MNQKQTTEAPTSAPPLASLARALATAYVAHVMGISYQSAGRYSRGAPGPFWIYLADQIERYMAEHIAREIAPPAESRLIQ